VIRAEYLNHIPKTANRKLGNKVDTIVPVPLCHSVKLTADSGIDKDFLWKGVCGVDD
jgi:hypothetical protein